MLNSPIENLKGLGPRKAETLKNELGIFVFKDLLYHFPFRYIDRTHIHRINEVPQTQDFVQIKGVLGEITVHGGKRATRMTSTLQDSSGIIELVWFRGFKWLRDSLKPGSIYIAFGKPTSYQGKYNIAHPELIFFQNTLQLEQIGLQPVYPSTEKLKSQGLDSRGFRKILSTLFLAIKDEIIQETLPAYLINKIGLPNLRSSLYEMHFPKSLATATKASKRLKFEELYFAQLTIIKQRIDADLNYTGHKFSVLGDYFNTFYHKILPFELTDAQKRVLKEVRFHMNTGKQMNRLIQGDVGSGKTMIALFSMLMACDNGLQACLMAPTEILAQQHYKSISESLFSLGLKVEILTGSTKAARRREILAGLKSGDINLVIGTHALIEDKVVYANLGLVVVDEQHRFGVAQRARLWMKNNPMPHVLIMTATPIPRTLAMTLYGDLEVSVIDELPPGRKPIKTVHYTDADRLRVFGFMKEEIQKGQQVYIVYPLIEENETLDLNDLTEGYQSITRVFPMPDYHVGMLHGKLKPAEKEFEMERFVKNETQILVSTTVIEVGVNIPNATIMLIENAERFGLSQLHQLRGRVGRGSDASYCILMTKDNLNSDAYKRIKTMTSTNDGFKIAEVDLEIRGSGDLQGTKQSGMMNFKIADLQKDQKILEHARKEVLALYEEDPKLELDKNAVLKNYLAQEGKAKLTWAKIS